MIRPPQDKSNGHFHTYSGSENKRASDKHLEACPQCGASGKASFYLISRCRKLGGIAAWHCNQCNKFFPQTEAVANNSNEESLTPEEREEVYYGYGVLADRLNGLLNDPKGKRGMDYLRSRDLSLETINHPLVRAGYHPPVKKSTGGIPDEIAKEDRRAYEGLRKGGVLTARSGLASRVLKNRVLFPYIANGQVVNIRGRTIDGDSVKYASPSGQAYAGGTPVLYLHDVLSILREEGHLKVILTEGEVKALAPFQAWEAGLLSMPGVSTPGISNLQPEMMDQLRDFTVFLCYDSEERKDPFKLSPGELFTIRNGEKLIGLDVDRQLKRAAKALKEATDNGNDELAVELQQQVNKLTDKLNEAKARNIKVRVVRLPRFPTEKKLDLDDFIQKRGIATLQYLLDHAPSLKVWLKHHGGNGYQFREGSIYKGGKMLANYQAIITCDVVKSDGYHENTFHLLALQSPSGLRRNVEISSLQWTESSLKAMAAIRTALLEGSADDEGREAFRAIKTLSRQGDEPLQRVVFTVPGWQYFGSWHYLAGDGSINANGINYELRAELNKSIKGNHYELCGKGDPKQGWEGTKLLLSGKVGPQALAFILIAANGLAPIHRFTDTSDRPTPIVYGETGSLKTSFVRVFLSYYGPRFTVPRSGGAPVLKWSDTAKSLLQAAFFMRDVPFLMDDYKQAIAKLKDIALVLHALSEGAGRGRLNPDGSPKETHPPRGLGIITAESLPSSDPGQLGRVLPFPIGKGGNGTPPDIDKEMLTEAQKYGARGHLAAFWRGYIQFIAKRLDDRVDKFQEWLREITYADQEAFGEACHERVVDSLRQNYVGWYVFMTFLCEAKYITSDERKELDTLYNQVRLLLADMHTQATEQENPAQKILALITDGLNTGEIVIEGKPLPGYGFNIKEMRRCTSCGNDHKQSFYFLRECRNLDNQPAYHCEACGEFFLIEGVPRGYRLDGFPLKANPQIIGFYCNPSRSGEPAVALYPQAVWTYIQKTLGIRGERINHNANDIWAQLYSGGHLTRIQQGKRKRYDPMTYNAITGGKKRALNIKPVYVLGEPPPKEPQPTKNTLQQSPPPPEYDESPEVQDHDLITSPAQNSEATVDDFYRDCVSFSQNSAPNQREVYETYLKWCAEESRTPISKANFNYEFSQYVETDEAQWIGIEVGYKTQGLF